MIVHRLLDAVFRTLDTVDAIRARVDAVLGRAEAQPPSSWPPVIDDDDGSAPIDATTVRAVYSPADTSVDGWAASKSDDDDEDATGTTPVTPKTPKAPKTTKQPTTAKKATATAAKKAATTATPLTKTAAKKTPTTKKKPTTTTMASRKGSVDRLGKDLDSPRANEVASFIASNKTLVVDEEAALDGKRTLARVLWAVAVAEQAGIDDGLTAADASALLSTSARVEVFSTNVARAFRDEHELFAETTPDGRSKRYALTAAGRARLHEVALR